MKAVVAAFNQEKALVGAFSVITNLRMELFEALVTNNQVSPLLSSLTMLLLQELRLTPVLLAVTVLAQLTAGSQVIMSSHEQHIPWNNGKEVPRWGVVEIQKMSPSTTGRCK